MAAKRKTLPEDFEALIDGGDLERLQAVFDTCELNARGGYAKCTALSFRGCPDELTRWLVAQGADLEAPTPGATPRCTRAPAIAVSAPTCSC